MKICCSLKCWHQETSCSPVVLFYGISPSERDHHGYKIDIAWLRRRARLRLTGVPNSTVLRVTPRLHRTNDTLAIAAMKEGSVTQPTSHAGAIPLDTIKYVFFFFSSGNTSTKVPTLHRAARVEQRCGVFGPTRSGGSVFPFALRVGLLKMRSGSLRSKHARKSVVNKTHSWSGVAVCFLQQEGEVSYLSCLESSCVIRDPLMLMSYSRRESSCVIRDPPMLVSYSRRVVSTVVSQKKPNSNDA